jgi:probable HAF family extracellular repeat protein
MRTTGIRRTALILVGLLGVLALSLGAGSAAAAKPTSAYSVIDIGDFNGRSCGEGDPFCNVGSGAYGINSRGDVVGWSYYTWDGSVAGFQYDRSTGELTWLQSLPGFGWSRYGYAVNDVGVVAGTASAQPAYRPNYPVVWAHGLVQDLFAGITSCANPSGVPGVDCSGIATDLNDAGQVVGGWYITERSGLPTDDHGAFVYSGGAFKNLGWLSGDADSYATAINERGDIVGRSLPSRATFSKTCCGEDLVSREGSGQAFLYRHGVMRGLGTLGGPSSGANDISDNRKVAGFADTTSGERHAFIYSADEGMRDLGTLGGAFSEATAISPHGKFVVGNSTTASGELHGFLYTKGEMADLNALIPAGVGVLVDAQDVNDSGQIAGRILLAGRQSWEGDAVLLEPASGVR